MTDDADSLAGTTTVDGERDRVQNWRARYFLRLGYPPHEALEFADSDIDPHDVEALLRAGCPHDTAIEIVS